MFVACDNRPVVQMNSSHQHYSEKSATVVVNIKPYSPAPPVFISLIS